MKCKELLRGVLMVGAAIGLIAGCTAAPSSSSNAADATAGSATAAALPAPAPPANAAAASTAAATQAISDEIRPDFWLESEAVQGAVIAVRAPSGAVSVTFNGQPIVVAADGFFVIGFDRDAENSASLSATLSNGKTVERYIPVRPAIWRIERVNANPTGGAKTSAEFQARRGAELAQINAARGQKVQSSGWRQDFIWPVRGRISGVFGSQRIYNGSPGSYHSGLDIAMPAGTTYVAPADGVVVLAAQSPFTLEGYLLMIDHGMGLNSAFLHSSELLVRKGDVVKQGQAIGRIGATGRASGPHLHWGMKWNAARVDPLPLLSGQ